MTEMLKYLPPFMVLPMPLDKNGEGPALESTHPTSTNWTHLESLDRPPGSTCELIEGYTEDTLLSLPDESRAYVVKDAKGKVLPPPHALAPKEST